MKKQRKLFGKGKKTGVQRFSRTTKTSSGIPARRGRVKKYEKPRDPNLLHGPVKTIKQSKVVAVESHLDRKRYATPRVRAKVLKRDGFRCRYCGMLVTNDSANIDHIKPWLTGGRTRSSNLVTSCKPCNKRKGNRIWTPRPIGFKGKYKV